MNKTTTSALFFLMIAGLSGCSTIKSAHNWIIDIQRPTVKSDAEEYRKIFEEGRRAELQLDFEKAATKYEDLIRHGNRYGEYGLAKLQLNWYSYYPGYKEEAIRYFLDCARRSCKENRSGYRTDYFQDSDMDSAFSVAAMTELAVVAEQDSLVVDQVDIAKSLRRSMFNIVTPNVSEWAHTMKTNMLAVENYKDIIFAVEFAGQGSEYVRALKWDEIEKAFVDGNPVYNPTPRGGGQARPGGFPYSVIRFERSPKSSLFKYDFEVRLNGSSTFDEDERIKSALRRQLTREYQHENPYVDINDVGTSISWNHVETTITGSVVAMSMKSSVVRMEYTDVPVNDGTIGHGKLVFRLGGSDMVDAIDYVTRNIKKLVNRPDIPTDGGQRRPPPDAFYKVRGQHMTEDGLLEIEFDAL